MSNKHILFVYFIGSYIAGLAIGVVNVNTLHSLTPSIKTLIDIFTIINFFILIYINRHNQVKIKNFIFYIFFASYFISLFLINYNDQPLAFVITEYRPIILIFLLLFVAYLKDSDQKILFLPKYSIYLFLIASIYFVVQYSIFSFSGVSRRDMYIFREQNFELIALCILAISVFQLQRARIIKNVIIILVSVTLTIAKSTSVIVAFFCAFTVGRGRMIPKVLLTIFSVLIIYYVLQSRYGSLSNILLIDRLKYIYLFYIDISEHSLQDILLSFKGVQPVSSYTCDTLYYFDQFRVDGKCYPVIYHMIILRNLHVFGFIPTIMVNLTLYWSLWRLFGYRHILASMIFVLLFLSGLSVAGYANGLAMFSLSWIILLMDKKKYLITRTNY